MLEDELESGSPSIVAQPPEGRPFLPGAADLECMSVDELWSYREMIEAVLAPKIAGELASLKQRLELLNAGNTPGDRFSRTHRNRKAQGRRPYPSVPPKYRNPKIPSETWSGRGRQPRWVQIQLGLGKRLDEFLIG